MKTTVLLGGMIALCTMSATEATATTLDPGLYNITFTGTASGSETDPVSISGTGSTRDIEFASAAGSQIIHLTVSGTTLSGSANLKGVMVTLNGSESGTGASGSFHASRSARAGTGSFTITRRSAIVAHMMKATASSNSGSWWDSVCNWFGSFLAGSDGGGTAAPPSGSGSNSRGLADYHPPH